MKYRFSLRNQHKISNSFGADFLLLLLTELKKYFDEGIINLYNSDKEYKLIIVGDHEFYVIRELFNCFNLAYKPK